MALRKRLLLAFGVLLLLILVSTTGYRLLGGHSVTLLQALYMSVITLAGVGYSEIVDTSHNPALRIFNIGIVLIGVALTVYVFSVVAAFLVEVENTNPFWRRRMQKRINEASGHFIVCGLGDTGRHALEELQKTGTPYVAIELLEDNIKRLRDSHPAIAEDLLYIIGDATEEEVLEKAGIEKAKGIIIALPHDKDNLVVTVIVRQRFPRMRIVARAADQRFSERMLRAGAQSTVSPSRIGGLRMASELIRPHVVGFLDLMLKAQSQTLRVEQIEIAGAPWAGLQLKDIQFHRNFNLLVLAVKSNASDQMWVNPPDTLVVRPGSAVILLGDVKDIQRAREKADTDLRVTIASWHRRVGT
jgi:voltage-gated potassium channel